MEPAVDSLLEIESRLWKIGMAMQVRHDGGSDEKVSENERFRGLQVPPTHEYQKHAP